MKTKSVYRRNFLKTAGLVAASSVFSRFSIGQAGPSVNSKLNIAFIGAGGRGSALINGSTEQNHVAFCDVDDVSATKMYSEHPNVPRFRDFREMLDKKHKEIDAVCVATPDLTHFVGTYAAMEHGKHVFTEKPLTHNIWQARTLRKAAHHFDVVTQMGNQGHATEGIRYIKEWYEAGVIGEVDLVVAYNGGAQFGPNRFFNRPSRYPATSQAIPATLNWNLWKGPLAEDIKYNEVYLPKTWRAFFKFGNGQLGDWACHTLDAPFWALGLDSPSVVDIVERDKELPDLVPARSIIRLEFERPGKNPLVLLWHEGITPEVDPAWGIGEWRKGINMVMVGSKGCITTGARPNSPRLYPEEKWQDFRRNPTPKVYPRIKGSHITEWIKAIQGDGPAPGSNFDYSSRLTEMTLLGVMAQRSGERVEWDSENMNVTNNPSLNELVKAPVRRGWEYGESMGI